MRVGTRITIPGRGRAPVEAMESAGGSSPLESESPASPSDVAGAPRSTSVPGLVHVVSRGESLWTIARRYDVSVSQVREWNPDVATDDQIYPGDALRVQEPGSVTYTVRTGDTIWDIAEAHGMSADALLRYNGMSGRGFIRPGDRVQIPPQGIR